MMKKQIVFLFFTLMAFSMNAQHRWGIVGGVNLSTSSAKDFGWRAGGYIGGLYDIRLSDVWYIQPQLLYTYEENQTNGKSPVDVFYSRHALTLPVLASVRVDLYNGWALRINVGPYVQYALFGRNKVAYSNAEGESVGNSLGWWHAGFGDRFSYGLKGGLALGRGHWFGVMDCNYSLKKSFVNYDGHGLTLSAGMGYKF